jgi:hypothetical protein
MIEEVKECSTELDPVLLTHPLNFFCRAKSKLTRSGPRSLEEESYRALIAHIGGADI